MFNTLFFEIAYGLLFFSPIMASIWTLRCERKRYDASRLKPFDDLTRRPAGEHTRLQLEKVEERINDWLVPLVATPAVFAFGLALQPRHSVQQIIVFFLIAALFAALTLRKLRPLLKERANCHLGFQAERFVAEELNLLMADG